MYPPSFSSPVVISHGTQEKERRLTESSYYWPLLAFCVTLVCEFLYLSTVLSHGTQGNCGVSSDFHWPMTFINMPAAMQYPPLPLPSSAPEISTLGVLNIINSYRSSLITNVVAFSLTPATQLLYCAVHVSSSFK